MNTALAPSDYKKWLLYSFDNQNFENYYNLYKALQKGDTFGSVKVTKFEIQGVNSYAISLDNITEELQVTDEQRPVVLKYLIENYFHTEDLDQVMAEKKRQSEITKNHKFIEPDRSFHTQEKTDFKVKQHPKETFYFNIKLAISIIFYTILTGIIVWGIMSNLTSAIYILLFIPIIVFVVLVNKIAMGLFIGIIRGSSIQITKDQYPDIYQIVEEQAKKLKISVPEIYIASGHFNAFVTKFSRSHILMIYSEVIETTLNGNYDTLKYVTAHELCHIKQRHIMKRKYLFPSQIIPFIGLAYSRGCEYTCDRVGYHFSPKGSIEGILIMTTGKEIHSKFNVELHIQNATANEGFWTWFSEKFLTHPHLYKRLIEIKKFSKYN
jgi:Zn-dependent protease with chaperone function